MNWWDEQVTRPAAAWIARGGRRAPATVEEQLAARIMPGFETNVAKPKRRRRRDDSTAPDDFPPASQKKKLQRASKRQREKSAKQELETFRQQTNGGGKDYGNKGQRKTEICMMWNKKHGKCAGVAVCPMGRAHKCWLCLSTAHTGTEGGCL